MYDLRDYVSELHISAQQCVLTLLKSSGGGLPLPQQIPPWPQTLHIDYTKFTIYLYMQIC